MKAKKIKYGSCAECGASAYDHGNVYKIIFGRVGDRNTSLCLCNKCMQDLAGLIQPIAERK